MFTPLGCRAIVIGQMLALRRRTPGERVRFMIACALAMFLVPAFGPHRVSGEEYLPLWIGNRWEYRAVAGAAETQVINRMLSIWGTELFVIDYEASTSNEGLENYWTTEAEGDVFLWGFFRNLEEFGALYQPAIRVVDAPLYVGKTWSDSVAIYWLPDTLYAGTYEIAWRVYDAGTLVVPAGSFFAYGIGQTLEPPPSALAGYSLAGAAPGERGWSQAAEWYSDGVGEVQYHTDHLYQLVFYDQPTVVEGTTWGRIKSRFMW